MKLKQKTQKLHTEAEQQEFSQKMVRGDITKKEYISYLNILHSIMNELENHSLPHPDLKRVSSIKNDIEELGGMVDDSDISQVYVKYLQRLDKDSILPHVYLNYMALMFGGRIMKDKLPGSGTVFDFDNQSECIKSIRKIQKNTWVDEVNRGYIFWIDIYKQLEKEFK